jgi:hypothetical protein
VTASNGEAEQVAVIEGTKGSAQIFEVWQGGRLIEYQVRFGDELTVCRNIGEAYIVAGEKAGAKT